MELKAKEDDVSVGGSQFPGINILYVPLARPAMSVDKFYSYG